MYIFLRDEGVAFISPFKKWDKRRYAPFPFFHTMCQYKVRNNVSIVFASTAKMLTSASQFQHSQFSSQQNVSRNPLGNFGSTPHLPLYYQPQQPQYQEYQTGPQGYREIDAASRQQFYLHDSPPPPQRRTWAQHAQIQQENQSQELRGWQVGVTTPFIGP